MAPYYKSAQVNSAIIHFIICTYASTVACRYVLLWEKNLLLQDDIDWWYRKITNSMSCTFLTASILTCRVGNVKGVNDYIHNGSIQLVSKCNMSASQQAQYQAPRSGACEWNSPVLFKLSEVLVSAVKSGSQSWKAVKVVLWINLFRVGVELLYQHESLWHLGAYADWLIAATVM